MEKITPIIVVGMNRSGTRWFTTLLCKHPEISGVRAVTESNPGALAQETNMFGIFPKMYGDISDLAKYVAIVEQWSTTLFFSYMGIERKALYELHPRPKNCYSLFAAAMDIHSRNEKTAYWVQKMTPTSYKKIIGSLPDGKYIVLKRDIVSNIKSKLKKENNNKSSSLYRFAKLVFLYVTDAWVMKKLLERNNVSSCEIRYEDLVANTKDELVKVCKYLGVDYSSSMLEGEIMRNSRFSSLGEKKEYLTKKNIYRIKVLYRCYKIIPGAILWRVREKYASSGDSKFINATFRSVIKLNNL